MAATEREDEKRGRNNVLRAICAILLFVILVLGACSGGRQPYSVILICIDTLRADHVGCCGYTRDTTPHIDSLAAYGTMTGNAIAQSPWTVPSVASILTGCYYSTHRAGLPGKVKNLDDTVPNQISPNIEMLAEILKRNGYSTGLFSANPFLVGRFQNGFDQADVGSEPADRLFRKAWEWVAMQNNPLFFLHIQPIDLHHPINPPEKFFNFYPAESGGERGVEHEGWRHSKQDDLSDPDFLRFRDHKIAVYDGALRFVDTQVGWFIDSLEVRGLLDNVLVIITSDHGEEFWDHAEEGRGQGTDPREFWGIGHGHTMYQELLRVPLIFSGPGVRIGERIGGAVRLIDIAPTILDYCGIPLPAEMEGANLFFRGPGDTAGITGQTNETVLSESPAYGPDARTILMGDMKLVLTKGAPDLLFNLEEDPEEKNNIAKREPEEVQRMINALGTAITPIETGGENEEELAIDSQTIRELRALGYLGGN